MIGGPHPAAHEDLPAVETLQVFLDQARSLAVWHRDQADAFESKAGTVMGFTGVILTLLTLAGAPIADVENHAWRTALVVLVIAAAVCFLVTAVASIMALRVREYRFASAAQLQREWVKFYDGKPLGQAEAVATFADQLIRGSEGHKAPIESLSDDARTRGRWVSTSIWSMLVRIRSPWPPTLPGQYLATAPIDKVPTLSVRAPDVQACLTVLGRARLGASAPAGIELFETDLRRAVLRDVHMEARDPAVAEFPGSQYCHDSQSANCRVPQRGESRGFVGIDYELRKEAVGWRQGRLARIRGVLQHPDELPEEPDQSSRPTMGDPPDLFL
jgi:hypothetical protein